MVIFERLGGWGLGNSLFQIATTYAIAKDNNQDYGFPYNCSFRKSRFSNDSLFNTELPWVDMAEYENSSFWGIGGVGYKSPPKTNENLVIDGFFQSYKYFNHYKNDIKNLFSLKEQYKNFLINKYSRIIRNPKYCSIHIRRGDSLTNSDVLVLTEDYFFNAVEYVGFDKTYVVFSDDIEWCKTNLNFIQNKIFVKEYDLLEMHLMSLIHTNIIANSTFSWWGSYLGETNQVIAPNPNIRWFSNDFKNMNKDRDLLDLIPKEWHIL